MKTSKIMTDAELTSTVVSISSSRQPKQASGERNGAPPELQRRLSDLEADNRELRVKQQELQAELAELRTLDEELLVREKLESLGTLAGGLAHNFNNVLTALLGNIQLARMQLQHHDQADRYLEEALKAGERAKELTMQLVVFAKGGEPIIGTTDIAQLIRGSANLGSDSGIGYELVIPENLWPANADGDQIKQVIRNLLSNAEQAMPQGGTIRVSCNNVTVGTRNSRRLRAGNYVEVAVRDKGSGIAAEHLAKVFDPYFTTRPGSRGLGLATAYSIINKHAGSISVASQSGAGTEVRFCLPAADVEMADKGEEATCQGSGRVLIMDDEMPVLELTGSVVRELGYDFELARDGHEALERYTRAQQANNPFDLVIMDLTVPGGMGGRETMENLLRIDPGARAIAASGYSNDPVMANHREYGFKGIICKPYDIDKLGRVLTDVMQWK